MARPPDYRTSHSSTGHGRVYDRTYERGYYRLQWELVERPLLHRILHDRRACGDRRYLDFACGTGRILGIATEIFPECTGVDVSSAMLEVARERCPQARLLCQDISREPLDGCFDVVTAFRFFLNAQEELRRDILVALRSALRPGGVLVANVHVNEQSLLGRVYRLRNRIKGSTIANTYGLPAFARLLRDHGFEVEQVRWYSYWPRTGTILDASARWLMVPAEEVGDRSPGFVKRQAQAFMVCARRRDEDEWGNGRAQRTA